MKGRCNKKSLKECMLQVIKLFIQNSDNTTKYLRTDIELHKGGKKGVILDMTFLTKINEFQLQILEIYYYYIHLLFMIQ